MGFKLLERKNRGFTLTPAGEYFYQKSLILTADYEKMCSAAAKIAKGDQATLKIGYLRSYSGNEFHRALALFSEKYPDVAVSVEYGNHEELYAMLRSEQADIILNDQRRAFSEEYARRHNCFALRMDTNARNTRAREMYRKLGYEEIGIVTCVFNGIPNVRLVCLEKSLKRVSL